MIAMINYRSRPFTAIFIQDENWKSELNEEIKKKSDYLMI